jgi:signal transduction histidine kinase/CheY-like chemotaxis protein/CHASE3 domain sensor protein
MLNRVRIGTKIGLSFVLGWVTFIAIGLVAYRAVIEQKQAFQSEAHTYEVLATLEELMSAVRDAEVGQRGYLLTGAERYLEPYNTATTLLDDKLTRLKTLTADNPTQQSRLVGLTSLIQNRVDVLKEVISIRRTQGIEAATRAVLTDRGRNLTLQIGRVAQEIETEERELLKQRSARAAAASQQVLFSLGLGIPLYSILLALISYVLARHISNPLRQVSDAVERVGEGDLSVSLPVTDRHDEVGILSQTLNEMIAALRDTNQKNTAENWLKTNVAEFSQLLQGRRNIEAVTTLILSKLAPLVEAQQAVFYILERDHEPALLKLLSSYAYQERKHLANQFRLGEGLVGQAALEKQRILLTQVPSDYIRISSGLGEASPLNIVVLPVLFESQVIAVMELASFQKFSDLHLNFLDQVSETIGVVLNAIATDMRTEQLLKQSQELAEELQLQQEELRQANRQLEEKTQELEASEYLLKQQQEELQQNNEELQQLNEELEEKAELLSNQNQEVARKNQEVEAARVALQEKAEQLELTSKYKSEFLANMSHELRTPLNSLLILARLLSENSDGNLSHKQVEYSRTIYSAGTDLLELINDILDLAKIESGTMSIEIEPIPLRDIQQDLERVFRQIAQDKGLKFAIEIAPTLPDTIPTDPRRLQQILKNLLSNAFKFTDRGEVVLRISPATPGMYFNKATLNQAASVIAFAVSDTGIGVSPEKQKIIFEAFQQADGSTSRKYGGTGLGLSISRELANLLNGEIHLMSQPGLGSTFTLFLPGEGREPAFDDGKIAAQPIQQNSTPPAVTASVATPTVPTVSAMSASTLPQPIAHNDLGDDRDTIQPGDRVLLIIEDDMNFAKILLEMARQQGFKALVTLRGYMGLELAQQFKPNAIMLDIHLPDTDGWTILNRLKHDAETRHIPVHILSVDEEQQRGLQQGAIAYLQKPISPDALTQALVDIKQFIERPLKHLLVVEDDPAQAQSIIELIGNGDVKTIAVGSGAEALATLQAHYFDCMVLDLGLPDMSGFDLIEQIKQIESLSHLPIIVYTGKELTRQEETQLKRIAETIIIKDVRSPERLLDETALFLHRVQANLPQPKREMLEQLQQSDSILAGKKILIIDDDVRNIFALTGLLERYQMQVVYAENGRDGITILNENPDVSIVLMDVMMPEMDGYETTRAIRQLERFRNLPIVALTAKAMQGDRERCIEAGASDYITKPVDTEQLLSLLRVWLYR